MPGFVDFHCHLEHPAFAGGLKPVVGRAREAGVEIIVSAGSSPAANRAQLEIKKQFPGDVQVVLGISPHDHETPNWREELKFIRSHSSEIVGIGEIGLDLHHFGPQTMQAQEEVFVGQLELAEELSLPVVVHSRKAEQRVFELLAGFPSVKAMMHFFLLPKLAAEAARRGWLVSLPTVKSQSKHKIALEVGLQQLACETDSPFGLGPGRQSEPKDVVLAYEEIAASKKKEVDEVAQAIAGNAAKFFGMEL